MDSPVSSRNKIKPFKPAKTPRFLPGSIGRQRILQDLRVYNIHRRKVYDAKSTVDNMPPKLKPYNYFNVANLTKDAIRLRQIDLDNEMLVCKLNAIHRDRPKVDSWNLKTYNLSKWPALVEKTKAIWKHNREILKYTKRQKSVYQRDEYVKFFNEVFVPLVRYMSRYPLVILEKKTVDDLVNEYPAIGTDLPDRPRPRAYITFQIKDNAKLGQLVIELFDDYCPRTVENFLALCKSKDTSAMYLNCKVYISLKDKYFECGDVVTNTGKCGTSIYGPKFPEESMALRHCRPGVLSMVHLPGAFNDSRFSITMRPMPEFDGNRVAFGQVIRGNDVICRINDMSRAIGAPPEQILIVKCGVAVPKSRSKKETSNGRACKC